MLSHLLIQNYALIESLELSVGSGLNIITGETGAGKSILLGAIGLLTGYRADTKALYNPEKKCVIEGQFDVSGYFIQQIFEEEEIDWEPTCFLRREIAPNGKSRAFVNDTPVNLDTLRRIGAELMDIHSQHDSVRLGSQEYQLQIIDTYAQHTTLLDDFKSKFQTFRKQQIAYDTLLTEAASIRKEYDYNAFLLEELAKANLHPTEQTSAEAELRTLENAEEIRYRLGMASGYLQGTDGTGVLDGLQSTLQHLQSIAGFSKEYAQLRERVQSCLIELKDLSIELDTEQEAVELDDQKIVSLKERLSVLYHLQKKHNTASVAALIEIRDTLAEKVAKVANLDDALKTSEIALQKVEKAAQKAADVLSVSRKKVLPEIEKQVKALLTDLGIPNGQLAVEHKIGKLYAEGQDTVNFLFSANKGIAPRQLREVASGGEFSRLMLAVKYLLADKRSLPTIIFDEIDTGISGEIAVKVGGIMREMAQGHQLIAITHLHQIAARGDVHYFVYKDHSSAKTVSLIRRLSTEERVLEIAQMIGGANPSVASIENARAMLAQQITEKTNYKLNL